MRALQYKALPTLIKEKEPFWYRVPTTPHQAKHYKKKITGDEEGCRLDWLMRVDKSYWKLRVGCVCMYAYVHMDNKFGSIIARK